MDSTQETNKFCRLCLANECKLIDIFNQNEDINKYILNLFGVKIQKTDPFSTKICRDCLFFVIEIIKKRLDYQKNDRQLKTKTKSEAFTQKNDAVKETIDDVVKNCNSNQPSNNSEPKPQTRRKSINTKIIEHNSNNLVNSETKEINCKPKQPIRRKSINNIKKDSNNLFNGDSEIISESNNVTIPKRIRKIKKVNKSKILTNETTYQSDIIKTNESVSSEIEKTDVKRPKKCYDKVFMHSSIYEIFKKDENITIPIYFWPYNFKAYIDLKQKPKPWPRYKELDIDETERRKIYKRRNKNSGEIIRNFGGKRKKFEDPTFHISYDKKNDLTNNVNQERSESRMTNASNDSFEDDAKYGKLKRRRTQNVQRFGAPVYYEQTDFNALDMMTDDQLNTSYTIYNIDHDRPDLINRQYYGLPIVDSSEYFDKNKHNQTNIKSTKESTSLVPKIDIKPNLNTKSESKIDLSQIVISSEDKWNNFFENFYQKPEQNSDLSETEDDSNNLFQQLLSVNEKRVYICPFCEKIIYTYKTYRRHVVTHQFKPDLQTVLQNVNT